MKYTIKVQEVDLPTRLQNRCDEHEKALQQIKDTISSGSRPVYEDLYALADRIYETARLSLQ